MDYDVVWAKIKDIVVKTLMCAESKMNTLVKMHVPDRRICYELFGFDIMLDASHQPWLIEVNTGPSLSAPSSLDMHIKHRMVANLFNLVGVVPYDRAEHKTAAAARRRARLTGVPVPGSSRARSAPERKPRPGGPEPAPRPPSRPRRAGKIAADPLGDRVLRPDVCFPPNATSDSSTASTFTISRSKTSPR